MKTCPRCGESKDAALFHLRSSSKDGLATYCKACSKVMGQDWHRRNRDKHLVQMRTWSGQNRESQKAKKAAWYAANKDRHQAAGRAWVERNREARNAIAAKYREMNRDACNLRIASWAKANHAKRAEAQNRRRARKRGVAVSDVDREYVIKRDGSKCHFCGKRVSGSDLHLDHLVPLALGGPHSVENLRVSCASCNLRSGPGRLPAQLLLVG